MIAVAVIAAALAAAALAWVLGRRTGVRAGVRSERTITGLRGTAAAEADTEVLDFARLRRDLRLVGEEMAEDGFFAIREQIEGRTR